LNFDHLTSTKPNSDTIPNEEYAELVQLWQKKWHEDLNNMFEKQLDYKIILKIDTNLIKSAQGQINFFKKLMTTTKDPNIFTQPAFTNKAVVDYRKFMYLKKRQSFTNSDRITDNKSPTSNVIVPTLFVDLMWHTHMLSPFEYMTDSVFLAGCILNHNDAFSDDTLSDGWKNTQKLWKTEFGEELGEIADTNADAYVIATSTNVGLETSNCPYNFQSAKCGVIITIIVIVLATIIWIMQWNS